MPSSNHAMSPEQIQAERDLIERDIEISETALERKSTFNVARLDSDTLLPESWDEAFSIMESIGAVVTNADEVLADDWPEIDKARLVNVECLLVTWSISDPRNETFGTPYLIVRGMTRSGKRFRFTDGSTGVCSQLIRLTEQRIKEGYAVPNSGLLCRNGLSRSDYKTIVVNKDGEEVEIQATTFYINNEPTD